MSWYDVISGLSRNNPTLTWAQSYQVKPSSGLVDRIIGDDTQKTIRYVTTAAIIVGAFYFLGGMKR